jgi:hypothetical protein
MRIHPLTPLLSIAIAVLVAAPAEAAKTRKYRPHVAAYVQPSGYPRGPNSVWFGNEYLGADPDPRIRYELLRDLGAHFGGNR